MARFEIGKARRLAADGKADRAAVALRRARIWHQWSIGAGNAPGVWSAS
jgi:hypothetical protein